SRGRSKMSGVSPRSFLPQKTFAFGLAGVVRIVMWTLGSVLGASCSVAAPPSGTARAVTSAAAATGGAAAERGFGGGGACAAGALFGGDDEQAQSSKQMHARRISRLPHQHAPRANPAPAAAVPADTGRPAWARSL